jgi:hypothetical protein
MTLRPTLPLHRLRSCALQRFLCLRWRAAFARLFSTNLTTGAHRMPITPPRLVSLQQLTAWEALCHHPSAPSPTPAPLSAAAHHIDKLDISAPSGRPAPEQDRTCSGQGATNPSWMEGSHWKIEDGSGATCAEEREQRQHAAQGSPSASGSLRALSLLHIACLFPQSPPFTNFSVNERR